MAVRREKFVSFALICEDCEEEFSAEDQGYSPVRADDPEEVAGLKRDLLSDAKDAEWKTRGEQVCPGCLEDRRLEEQDEDDAFRLNTSGER